MRSLQLRCRQSRVVQAAAPGASPRRRAAVLSPLESRTDILAHGAKCKCKSSRNKSATVAPNHNTSSRLLRDRDEVLTNAFEGTYQTSLFFLSQLFYLRSKYLILSDLLPIQYILLLEVCVIRCFNCEDEETR